MSFLRLKNIIKKDYRNRKKSQSVMIHKSSTELSVTSAEKIILALSPELKNEVSKRSSVKIKGKGKKLIISVESTDINALRAGLNNTLRLIMAYEKASSIR
ncbi:MAG: hypothetical protein JW791_04720 [Nanoarchaeota archaeon]|nr:hypothetical protein [Nanoarchaeota archaeon]